MAPDGAGQETAGSKSIAGLRRVVECVAAQQEELVRQRDELADALRKIKSICEDGHVVVNQIATLASDALAKVPA